MLSSLGREEGVDERQKNGTIKRERHTKNSKSEISWWIRRFLIVTWESQTNIDIHICPSKQRLVPLLVPLSGVVDLIEWSFSNFRLIGIKINGSENKTHLHLFKLAPCNEVIKIELAANVTVAVAFMVGFIYSERQIIKVTIIAYGLSITQKSTIFSSQSMTAIMSSFSKQHRMILWVEKLSIFHGAKLPKNTSIEYVTCTIKILIEYQQNVSMLLRLKHQFSIYECLMKWWNSEIVFNR